MSIVVYVKRYCIGIPFFLVFVIVGTIKKWQTTWANDKNNNNVPSSDHDHDILLSVEQQPQRLTQAQSQTYIQDLLNYHATESEKTDFVNNLLSSQKEMQKENILDLYSANNNNANFASYNSPMCSLCGRLGVPVRNDRIFPGIASCREIDLYYMFNVTFENCNVYPRFESFCCDQSPDLVLPTYECEQRVRDQILDSDDVTYSTAVTPVDSYTRTVEVETFIEYWYLSELDITSSSLDIYIAAYQKWKDPRLAWDINDENCVTSITVRASADPEKTDIWVPDFDLYNKERGIIDFPDAVATVYSDGTVEWYRGGFITAMCTFVGLRKMPFDEIGCQLLFGGRNTNVRYVLGERPDVVERNVTNTCFGVLSGKDQAYTEYKIMPERSNCDYYKDIYPSDFHVELFFKRSSRHYIQFILFPNILFVFLSFGQFFLSIGSTERLSFGVTVVLIMVTQSVVVSTLLPLCEESLWINTMSLYSTAFTVISLIITLSWLFVDKYYKTKEKNENVYNITDEELDRANELVSLQHSDNDDDDEEADNNGMAAGSEYENNSPTSSILEHEQKQQENNTRENDTKKKKILKRKFGISSYSPYLSFKPQKPKSKTEFFELMDDICVALLMIAYVIFLIIMYATLDNYDDEVDEDGNYVSWAY